jgi:F-type H+-transporting ATPase subunit epsilon
MSTVKDGALKVYDRDGAEPRIIAVEGGFAEVSETGLTVLAEKAA